MRNIALLLVRCNPLLEGCWAATALLYAGGAFLNNPEVAIPYLRAAGLRLKSPSQAPKEGAKK